MLVALYGCGGGGEGGGSTTGTPTAGSGTGSGSPSSIAPSQQPASAAQVAQTLNSPQGTQLAQSLAMQVAPTSGTVTTLSMSSTSTNSEPNQQLSTIRNFSKNQMANFVNGKSSDTEIRQAQAQREMCNDGGFVVIDSTDPNPDVPEQGDRLLITFENCRSVDSNNNDSLINGSILIEVTSVVFSGPAAEGRVTYREQLTQTVATSEQDRIALRSDNRVFFVFKDTDVDNFSDYVLTEQVVGVPESSFLSSEFKFEPGPRNSNSAFTVTQVANNILALIEEVYVNSVKQNSRQNLNYQYLGTIGDSSNRLVVEFALDTLKDFRYNSRNEVLDGVMKASFSDTVFVQLSVVTDSALSNGVPTELLVEIETDPNNMVREKTFKVRIN